MAKVEWLRERNGLTTAAPEFEGDRLRPFQWILLKCAEPPKGKPRQNMSLNDLAERAGAMLRDQMDVLNENLDWRRAEMAGARRCAQHLKEEGLLWKKESAAAQGIGKDPTRKGWKCHLCEDRFRQSRDLANHLKDRRAHGLDPEWVDNYIQKLRNTRDREIYDYYKSSIARTGLIDDHLNPDLNRGPLSGSEHHKQMIRSFMERSKRTISTDWAHRGSKKTSVKFKNGAPDVIRVLPSIDNPPCEYEVVENGKVKEVRVRFSPTWKTEKPFNIEFIAPPANKKRKLVEKALKRAEDRTLILVAEDGLHFITDIAEKKAEGPVHHITSDPATDLRLYREWEPGLVMIKAPEPEIQHTPEETYKEIKRLLSLGYDHKGRIKTTHGNHYFYMENDKGRTKEAGKICPDFWTYALEEKTFRTRSYIYKGEVKGKNFSRVEWTKKKTEWRKRHELLTP